jgi:hypothetical protein
LHVVGGEDFEGLEAGGGLQGDVAVAPEYAGGRAEHVWLVVGDEDGSGGRRADDLGPGCVGSGWLGSGWLGSGWLGCA